jgi:uncharacterized protein YbjQ (UPF0145 family)
MIVTTTDKVPDKEIAEILNVVRGNTVRAKHIGKDIMAELKGIVGGEIKQYTDLLTDAREQAYNRMISEAQKINADAIVNTRFMTSMVSESMSEILVYGTAVRLK